VSEVKVLSLAARSVGGFFICPFFERFVALMSEGRDQLRQIDKKKEKLMTRKATKITAMVAALALGTILVLPYVVNIDQFRPQIESNLKSALGREVHVGHMELSLLAGGARINQLSIAEDPAFSQGTFLEAKSLGVGVSFLSLIFSRSLHITSLTVGEPKLSVIKSAAGKWNFSSLGTTSGDEDEADAVTESLAPSTTAVVLDQLKISNATIELALSANSNETTTLRNIDVDLKNVSFDSAMSFILSAHTASGKLEIEGVAGPMNHDNPDQTPLRAKVTSNHFSLDTAEAILRAIGIELPGGSEFHGGTVTASLALDGPVTRPVTSGNAEVTKARLAAFDLGKKMSTLLGMGSPKGASSAMPEVNLSTHFHIASTGMEITGFKGEFSGIGEITGGGTVSANDHLQFKMVAHVPKDGAVRFGLNHVGLRNLPNDVPFRVVGTTSMPMIIPDLSGTSKNPTETLANNALKNVASSQVRTKNKKSGFFHKLFGRKS
jgi:hypothetical protein